MVYGVVETVSHVSEKVPNVANSTTLFVRVEASMLSAIPVATVAVVANRTVLYFGMAVSD